MAKEPRPKGYPKLKNYKPSQFMLPTSHYDKKKADRAVTFIENLCHTKGKWAGTPFWLLPWQEQLIRDIFGIVKPDGNRQFRTAFVEICKKVGKSELAAAVALYLLYADNEPSAEVYGAAADRQQASIVFDVAKQMVEMSPALMKRSKLMGATKRIVNYSNTFNVYLWMENGSGTVDVGDCIASVSGQAMAAGEAWDGKLEVEDYTTRFAIGGGLNVNGFRDSLSMQMKETVNRGFEVHFAERAGISGFCRPVEMEGV